MFIRTLPAVDEEQAFVSPLVAFLFVGPHRACLARVTNTVNAVRPVEKRLSYDRGSYTNVPGQVKDYISATRIPSGAVLQ